MIDIVMNFLALTVVADLDDYMFSAHSDTELAKKIVLDEDKEYEGCFTVESTSSSKAGQYGDGDLNKFEPGEDYKWVEKRLPGSMQHPEFLSIDFWTERSGLNKFSRLVYLFFRIFFVSFWFYFLPITALLVQFITQKDSPEQEATSDVASITLVDLS